MAEKKIGNKVLRLVRGDITDMEIGAFVFDITEDVKLGSGFGDVAIQLPEDRLGFAQVTFGEILRLKPDASTFALGIAYQRIRLGNSLLDYVVL